MLSHSFPKVIFRATNFPTASIARTFATNSRLLAALTDHLPERTHSEPSSPIASTSKSPSPVVAAAIKQLRLHTRPHRDWVLTHPVYTDEELHSVDVVRQPRVTVTDKVASALVFVARWGFDFVTRYKHSSPEEARAALVRDGQTELSLEELRAKGYVMTEKQWMARILFLESVAGVPGMVAGMLRHLRSLRLMKNDNGWISTLLQEAENERMHLMVFMEIRKPSKFFRALVLLTQGVFFNFFFLAYMISPKAAHRFVAYLEEEACLTYTQVVSEIEKGNIPEWAPGAQAVPLIAKNYWRLEESATMLDLVLAVRADEAGHRFLNHTLANLDGDDLNPFAVKHADGTIQGKVAGFSRKESIEWSRKVEKELGRTTKVAEK